MCEYRIKVARIEVIAPEADGKIRVTFDIESDQTLFHVPVVLDMKDFDDTEIVQVARGELRRTFSQLSAQTDRWTLTADEKRRLSEMSARRRS